MAHPQSSPRGLWQKGTVLVGTTGLTISGNSTGFIFGTRASKPAARSSSKVAFLTNSTGNNAVMVNTTGTTWKYLNVTSVLPT